MEFHTKNCRSVAIFYLYRNVWTRYKKEFLRGSGIIRMPVLLMSSFREAVQPYTVRQ